MTDRAFPFELDDPAKLEIWFEKESFPCPACGRALKLGGRKGWLIRRLRMHFSTCRPKHRVLKLREWRRLQEGIDSSRFAGPGSSHDVGTAHGSTVGRCVDPGAILPVRTGGGPR